MIRATLCICLIGILAACKPTRQTTTSTTDIAHPQPDTLKKQPETPKATGTIADFQLMEQRFQDHTGFMLYDPEQKSTIYSYNADDYFTPGSNTKIFTFYTSLRILGDSVPALEYLETKDSLIFWGTGDPSLLYKFTFNNFRIYDWLKRSKKQLYFSSSNFYDKHFGKGWAWDDYNEEFSPERTPFPIYGNIFSVKRTGSLLEVQPPYFDQFLSVGEREKKESIERDLHSNNFQFHPGLSQPRQREWDVPMLMSDELTCKLLSDTLKRNVKLIKRRKPPVTQPVYSILTDSLYSVLMQDSDNFIAEQLLLMCGGIVRDSMKTETAIRYALANYLNDLPDKPIWVDGSGLSRYNLFTARTIVNVWEKIFQTVPRERLFALLATGGVNGTLKKWYKAERPYIFGKTGTLSNNHSLSGFILTKSNKVLIFSFMNNNYVVPVNEVRANMQEILYSIYEKY